MNLESAMPLISAVGQLIAQLVLSIKDSVHMNAEQKEEALAKLSADLDITVAAVKSVRFDAIKKAD